MYIPSYKEEPFEWYKSMRTQRIVREGNSVHVFKYNDVVTVLSNHNVFSSQFRDLLGDDIKNELDSRAAPSILILDPPRHTELRGLVSSAFTPRKIESYDNYIRELAAKMIENIIEKRRCDLVSEISYPLPIMVISNMLGVPEKDLKKFKEWSDALATSLGRGPDLRTQREMSEYFLNMIDRDSNDDNLISRLSNVSIDDKKLTDQEITGFSILLLVAGNETTTNLITNALIELSNHPDIYKELVDNNKIAGDIVEETLRFRSPVQSTRRYAKYDYQINGFNIYKNDFIFLYLSSANRDEEIFKDPDNFNPFRENKRHIAFGNGIHFCLGAPLARLESRIVLEEFAKRIESFSIERLNPDDRIDSDIMYGYKRAIINVKKINQ
ncbi:cytochrome P450 [Picrophilus oshimae]|uniref:Cytochrome P450 n=1 Tax=Picrophilus torridus (strain ATCC 700027 / DSM 9790 / JCM 10055 / NBRC 100828 / KAW 2/3) TaxID=1122961 RepID=Q6L2Y1_PICTO|nr:cytochrome P450 [Picrophilus oshimae]AAT42670.1 cytochrome P450 [Picrophilus oshimae DSM 9789]